MKKGLIIIYLIFLVDISKSSFISPHLMPIKPDLLKKDNSRKRLIQIHKISVLKGLNQPTQKIPLERVRRVLCLLVDFSDNKGTLPISYFNDLLFSKNTYPTGSMRDYYYKNSYGIIDFEGEINGQNAQNWYRAPQPYSYYTNGQGGLGAYPKNAQKLVEDVVQLADPYVDFSKHDQDNDGDVDFLFIVHSGPGFESTLDYNDIHSHEYSVSSSFTLQEKFDGKRIKNYTIQPEKIKTGNNRIGITIGVFCHETGHLLGLPDLYDEDRVDNEYDAQGIGVWSIMATGAWNGNPPGSSPAYFDAWCKEYLGIVEPKIIKEDTEIILPPIQTNKSIYKLWKNGNPQKEYFLLENRQKIDFDKFLPGSGLLIYHIDNNIEQNNDQTHYKVAIEQADGLFQLEKRISQGGNNGNDGDPWPGSLKRTIFSYDTVPNSRAYDGTNTFVCLSNIREIILNNVVNIVMSCIDIENNFINFNTSQLIQNYPNPFNPETYIPYIIKQGVWDKKHKKWIENYQKRVEIRIYNILGQKIRNIDLGYKTSGEYITKDKAAYWDGKDNKAKEIVSGVYYYELVVDGKVVGMKKSLVLK